MALPTGPGVAFLFTDIEGSTRTERAVGSAVWAEVVARHDELMRRAIERHAGSVVKTEGDAFFAAFAGPANAVAAAADAQRAVATEPWPGGAPLESGWASISVRDGCGRDSQQATLRTTSGST